MGYAERNPEADVEGYDACRKLAILSSLMAGKNVDSEKIYTEGITKITTADFEYAKAAGMAIKLLALGRMLEDGRVLAMVSPFFVSNTHPLAMVNDVFNAVFISGNMLGDSMYYGRGAGKLPTASAVVSDVIECARNQGRTISCRWEAGSAELADIAETEYSYFVRVKASARAEAEAVFPGKIFEAPGREDDLGIFTDVMKEKTFREKYATLGDKALGRIRLL